MSSQEPIGSRRPGGARCPRHRRIDGLLLKVGTGDRTAFAALYDEMNRTVFAMGLRRGLEPGLAAEVTHDVFLDAWRQAPRYDPGVQSGWTWVHGLASAAMEGRTVHRRTSYHGIVDTS